MKKRILFAWLVGAIALSLACFGGCDKGGVQSGSSQGGASQGSSDSASEDVYADYTVEHYFEDLFGGFDVDEALTETASEKVGTTVSATTVEKEGFVFDSENAGNVASLTVKEGSNTLKLYYLRKTFTLTVVGIAVEEKTVKYGETVDLGGESNWVWTVTEGDAAVNGNVVTVGNSNATVKAALASPVALSPEIFTNVEDTVAATLAVTEAGEKQGIVFLYNLPQTQNLVKANAEYYAFYTENGKAVLAKNVNGEQTVIASCDATVNSTENNYSVSFNTQGIICYLNGAQVLTYESKFEFGGRVGIYQESGIPNMATLNASNGMSLQKIKEYAVYVMATLSMDAYVVAYNTLVEKSYGKYFATSFGELNEIVIAMTEEVNALASLDEVIDYMVEENNALQAQIAKFVTWSTLNTLAQDLTANHLIPYVAIGEDGHATTKNADGTVLTTNVFEVDQRWYIPDAFRLVSSYGKGLYGYFYDDLTANGNATAAEYLAVGDKYVDDIVKAVAINNYEFYYWYCRNTYGADSVYSEWWYLWKYCGAANTGYAYTGSVSNYSWPGDWRLPEGLHNIPNGDSIEACTAILQNYSWMRNYQTIRNENVKYTVNLSLNGGSGVDTHYDRTANEEFVLPVPTKENAEFDGWYVSRFFYGDPIEKVAVGNEKDLVLYAKWNEAEAEFLTPDPFFGDGMVLPRNKAFKVWGEGTDGMKVTVTFAGQEKTATVENGVWSVSLDACEASFVGAPLTVKGGSIEYVFNNVLVGEIWLGAGQSNMEYYIIWLGMKFAGGYNKYDNYDKVRLYRQSVIGIDEAGIEPYGNRWLVLNNKNRVKDALSHSALALAYALELQKLINVPVGVVVSSRGGTYIEEWLSPETNEKLGSTAPDELNSRYYQMTVDLKGIPFAGVLWCHGSNNCEYPELYVEQFKALCSQYRAFFENGNLPVIVTQSQQYLYMDFKDFRMMQWSLMDKVDNVYVVCIADTGNWYDIHPADKILVGARAANVAAKYVYDVEDANGISAYPIKIERRGNDVVISFSNAESGLVYKELISGFEVAGADGVFIPCIATVEGNTVVLKNVGEGVVQVRYLYAPVFNSVDLYTNNGLPVAPFWLQI